jgi:Spy/CpxP family protein refolding chaperone
MVSKLSQTRTIIGACVGLALIALVSAAFVFAQTQPSVPAQGGRGMRGMGPMGPMGPGGMRGRGPMGPGGFMGPGGLMGPEMFLGQIGLTDAQREQIRQIRQSHQEEVQALAQEGGPAREALRTAILNADANAIQNAGTAVASEIVKGALLAAKVQAEVQSVLTDEQKAKLKDLRATADQRREKLRGMHQGPPLF